MRTYLIALASAVTLLGCRGITLDSDQASTGPSFVPRFADAQPLPRSMCDGLADAWAAEEAAKKVLCTNCWDSGGTFYTVFEGETLTSMYCDCGPWKKFASSDAGTLELGWIGVQMMFGGTPQMYSCREDACTEAFLTTPSQCDQQLSSEEARGACQACFQEGFTAFDCAATLTNKTKRCANPEVPVVVGGGLEACPAGLECITSSALRGWRTHCMGAGPTEFWCCPTDRTLNQAKTACVKPGFGAEVLPLCDNHPAGDGLYCTPDQIPSGYGQLCINILGDYTWCCPADKVLNAARNSCVAPEAPPALPTCGGGLSCQESQPTGPAHQCQHATGGAVGWCCDPGKVLNEAHTACIDPPMQPCSTGLYCTPTTRPGEAAEQQCLSNGTPAWCCPAGKVLNDAKNVCIDPSVAPTLDPCAVGLYCVTEPRPSGETHQCLWRGSPGWCCNSGKILNDAKTACVDPPTLANCGGGLYCTTSASKPSGASSTQCLSAGVANWCCPSGKLLNDGKTACVDPPTLANCGGGLYCTTSASKPSGASSTQCLSAGVANWCCPSGRPRNRAAPPVRSVSLPGWPTGAARAGSSSTTPRPPVSIRRRSPPAGAGSIAISTRSPRGRPVPNVSPAARRPGAAPVGRS